MFGERKRRSETSQRGIKLSHRIQLPNASELLENVSRVVIEAGALIRAEFHRPNGPRGSGSKAPVDAEVEAFLMERLCALHPCDWHGEELARRSTGHADIWVVDPQDGTTAFLSGHRGSAVSVALLRQGQPVLGVVYAPLAPDDEGDLFVWADGGTALRNGQVLGQIGKPVTDHGRRSSPQRYCHATLLGFNEKAGDYAAHNHAVFAPAAILAKPSIAYRLALAAAGEVDAAISLTNGLDSYDVAGGHALLIGVGGALCQLDGSPIAHGHGRLFDGCIGGRPGIVEEVRLRRPSAGSATPRKPTQPAHRIASAEVLRRAQGALLGLLVGDALGAQVEFQSPDAIRRSYPDGLRELAPGGTWGLLAGQHTDDGEMALALARALVAGKGFDADLVGKAYIDWKASNPFDMGNTTSAGIAALQGRGSANLASQANGALMRVAPIGIACAANPEKAAACARQDAALTHPHPIAQSACAAFSAAVAVGVSGADRRTMWSVAHALAGEDAAGGEIRQTLIEAQGSLPPSFTKNQGWVLTAFGNAFHRLWIGQEFDDALVATVGEGGDTDTNAAVCGALLGAAQGLSAIPGRWAGQVLSCRAVKGQGVRHPRPTACWGDDTLSLAEALLTLD